MITGIDGFKSVNGIAQLAGFFACRSPAPGFSC